MSWRTRKRGTPRQIGKKFPVLQKKKLPKRISLKTSKRMCPTLQRLAGEGRSDYNDWLVQQHIEQWHDANGVCLVGIPRFQYNKAIGSRRLVYEKVATDYPSKLAEESLLEKVLGRGGKVSPEETRYRFYEYLKRKGLSEMEIADILLSEGGKVKKKKDFDRLYETFLGDRKATPIVKYQHPDKWRNGGGKISPKKLRSAINKELKGHRLASKKNVLLVRYRVKGVGRWVLKEIKVGRPIIVPKNTEKVYVKTERGWEKAAEGTFSVI